MFEPREIALNPYRADMSKLSVGHRLPRVFC
jgi:hypothetical protein